MPARKEAQDAVQDAIWLMPFRVIGWYLGIGALWILFSDRLLSSLVRDHELLTRLEIAKGWLFLLVTSVLLYRLIRRGLALVLRVARYAEANAALEKEIGQRRQAEEEITWLNDDLMRQKQELEAVNRELEAFSYSVSHDLRAPLRHIGGFTEALKNGCVQQLSPSGRQYLSCIERSCATMTRLIEDLLELARVSRSEMHLQRLDLSRMAREVAEELRLSDPSREVSFEIAEGLSGSGDAVLLRLVLANLLGNAFKYTGQTASARIEFASRTEEGRELFFVRDNGAGFDMKYADRLFGPFQRLHTSDQFEGSGVGLAIVQRVIRRHGGSVRAEAEPGKGATFYFTLCEPS